MTERYVSVGFITIAHLLLEAMNEPAISREYQTQLRSSPLPFQKDHVAKQKEKEAAGISVPAWIELYQFLSAISDSQTGKELF